MNARELQFQAPALKSFSLVGFIQSLFSNKAASPQKENKNAAPLLSFDGLNPALAKQLSELESLIGQLAQAQFQIANERRKMHEEMEALKKAMLYHGIS